MSGQLRHGATSDAAGREDNEDAYLAQPPLFIVADGMGGHQAGDVASKTAVESVEQHHKEEEAGPLSEAVAAANLRVHELAASDPGLNDMGTTFTGLVVRDDMLDLVHVGDSRAYLLRTGNLTLLTQDHSMVGRMLREGKITEEVAERHPQRSVLEKALGVSESVEVDSQEVDSEPGDRILLCSDGLTGVVSDNEILGILLAEDDPATASRRLANAAIKAGTTDNVTAVVIDLPGTPQSDRARPAKGVAKSKWRRRALISGILAAVILTAGLAGRSALFSSYYVGERNGEVAVFKGSNRSIAGINLYRLVTLSGLDVATLPEAVMKDLEAGIPAEDEEDARLIVSNLKLQSDLGIPK